MNKIIICAKKKLQNHADNVSNLLFGIIQLNTDL